MFQSIKILILVLHLPLSMTFSFRRGSHDQEIKVRPDSMKAILRAPEEVYLDALLLQKIVELSPYGLRKFLRIMYSVLLPFLTHEQMRE